MPALPPVKPFKQVEIYHRKTSSVDKKIDEVIIAKSKSVKRKKRHQSVQKKTRRSKRNKSTASDVRIAPITSTALN